MHTLSSDMKFCWAILPAVSRSFSLCISMLPSKTKDSVMLSYLLARIEDSIDDAKCQRRQKNALLKSFQCILTRELCSEKTLNSFAASVAAVTANQHERELVQNTATVMRCFRALPIKAKRSMKRWLCEMAAGWQNATRSIRTFVEQNLYCYYAAVTVGNLLTELFYHHGHVDRPTYRKLKALAADFGLALQKINIIKDMCVDLDEGRKYWPQELLARNKLSYKTLRSPQARKKALKVARIMINDAYFYAKRSFDYILMLPRREIKLRIFCCIPLFMALATLELSINNVSLFLRERRVKISRHQVSEIVRKSLVCAPSDKKLRAWFAVAKRSFAAQISATA